MGFLPAVDGPKCVRPLLARIFSPFRTRFFIGRVGDPASTVGVLLFCGSTSFLHLFFAFSFGSSSRSAQWYIVHQEELGEGGVGDWQVAPYSCSARFVSRGLTHCVLCTLQRSRSKIFRKVGVAYRMYQEKGKKDGNFRPCKCPFNSIRQVLLNCAQFFLSYLCIRRLRPRTARSTPVPLCRL